MYDRAHIYGLDIETDNTEGHGLDPGNSRITQVALVGDKFAEVFEGAEFDILVNLNNTILQMDAGLLTTWNGAFFDLPWLHDRAKANHIRDFGLRLLPQPGLIPKYDPIPGHSGGYAAVWDTRHLSFFMTQHAHFDISQAYKDWAEIHQVSWSLKPVCKVAGIEMFEIDRTRLHLYSDEEVRKYVLSDAVGTRELTLRLLGLV